jgi:predicted Zn-dependent protease
MKKMSYLLVWALVHVIVLQESTAQESPNVIQQEESAEVFLEEYTDEFQDAFFEALKQKGIQNYDRAINLLLKCKQLDASNNAVNHELAKTYFLDKKYIPAQQYAVEALLSEPENFWFLANLIKITDKQGITLQSLESSIPQNNEAFKVNLAKIYFQKGEYNKAKEVLSGIKLTPELSHLAQKINDSLSDTQKTTGVITVENTTATNVSVDVALENFRNSLKLMADGNNHLGLDAKAKQAMEIYPLQPEFYYYRGLALNRMKRSLEAVTILEEGLDYLFDNDQLANDFYKELANAHKAVGNISKANSYLSKVKPGFQ